MAAPVLEIPKSDEIYELRQRDPQSHAGKPISISSRDDEDMLRLRKKPVLKVSTSKIQMTAANDSQRNFGFMSILGFSCTVLITWEGILVYVGSL